MKIVLATHADRIAPLFDVARSFLLVDPSDASGFHSRELLIEAPDPVTRTRRLIGLGCDVLICGAISWPLERMLVASGVRVIPNTCGQSEQVLAAHLSGGLTERAFLLPGCPGRQHRRRRRRRGRGGGGRGGGGRGGGERRNR